MNKLSFVKKESKEDVDEVTQNEKFSRWWSNAESSRKELDWKWFQYDLFTNGNHFARWDKNTQSIVTEPKTDGHAKIVVNKTYATLRGVRSYVLQNRPKAEATPYNLTDETVDQAVKVNQFLDYIHDQLGLRKKIRASMWHALKYSVGFWQVLWDEDEQEIAVNVIDPYDLYIDPSARTMKEARYMILAVRRNIDDLKDDDKYKETNWEEVQTDQLLAASTLKSRILSYEKGQSVGTTNGKGDGGCIVKEYWYKQKGKDGKQHIMLCTRVGETTIRKPLDTGLDRMPFFALPSDIEPLSLYGQGWVKNLVPLNKLLDRLESSVAEYNDLMNKGKYVSDKGAGVKIINNEHGQIIEKKKGFEVTANPIPALNPAIFEQITNVNRYIEDLGSFHDASAGRIPSGAKSGVAIEALQEGDSNNLSELVENTEEFLEDVYEYILYMASQKYQFARDIILTTRTGQKEFLKVIGAGADDQAKPEGTTQIQEKNAVDVKIVSQLAYSAEGRRQAIKDLATLIPNLPPEFILEVYQIGNIADVVQKMKKQQAEQQQQEAQQQSQQAQAQGQAKMQQNQQQAQLQQQGKQQDAQMAQNQQVQGGAGRMEAIAFIRSVLSGQKPEIPDSVSPDFINYMDQFLQSGEAKNSVPGEVLSVLQQDRDQAMMKVRDASQVQTAN